MLKYYSIMGAIIFKGGRAGAGEDGFSVSALNCAEAPEAIKAQWQPHSLWQPQIWHNQAWSYCGHEATATGGMKLQILRTRSYCGPEVTNPAGMKLLLLGATGLLMSHYYDKPKQKKRPNNHQQKKDPTTPDIQEQGLHG